MKRLICTDTHLGLYSDSDVWLDVVLNFFKYIVKYCYKNDIHQIIHLGDFFDNRKSLNTKTQNTAHRIARVLEIANESKLPIGKNLHTYIIVGNHDCYYKNQIHPNTLELFNKYEHITVVDKPMMLDNIILVPWGQPDVDSQGAKYCMGHFDINGFYMNDSYKCKNGFDKDVFKDFEKVLSGHFHTPSSNHNITYLGAPYGQTFNDAGGIRGFHIFDDGKLDFIEYKDAPKFVKIHTTSEPLDENSVKGNIVRIIFNKDYGTTQNQQIIDNVLECKPLLYSVNFANIESDDGVQPDDENIEMESKDKIASQYIDQQVFSTNIKIDTLKAMFNKLMVEAGHSEIRSRSADGTRIECQSVGFQNFLSFGSKWQDINLHEGVNFVTGIDMDKGKSNGAGKSSFLETIPFALFGKTARDIRQDQIINWKNKKKCSVVFRFKINDTVYEIMRGLKPNKLEIYKDGELMDKDAHKRDYQGMFEEIFGMDVKMFMSLIHSNLNSSANIMSMKKADKRVFLERMFGLEIYSDMNKICNEKIKGLAEKEYKIKVDLRSIDDKIETAKNMIVKIKAEINSKKGSIENLSELKEKLNRLKEDNPEIDDRIDHIRNEIKVNDDTLNSIELEYQKTRSKLDTEINHLKKELKKIESQEKQRKKNTEIQERIKKITSKAGTLDDIQQEVEQLTGECIHLANDIEKERKKYDEISKDIIELKSDLRNCEKSLKLLSEGKCPTCGQDTDDPKGHFTKEQTSLKRKITNREKKQKPIQDGIDKLRDEFEKSNSKKEVLIKTSNTLFSLQNQLREVDSEEKKNEMEEKLQAFITHLEDVVSSHRTESDKIRSEIRALKNKLGDLERENSFIKAKEREIEIAETQAIEAKKHVESLSAMVDEQNTIIENANAVKHNFEVDKKRMNSMGDYLSAIKHILKDENIKQYTIKQIMPFLNKQTNHYLSEVNYGFYVSIDGWLDLDIKGPGIRDASYHSLSGGERRGIDIALQLSMLDISRTQMGIFPDLLILDELLDSSIDGKGINSLMEIVKVKQKEFDGKIFIITHRPEVDAELADHEYKVVKQNGFSKVMI